MFFLVKLQRLIDTRDTRIVIDAVICALSGYVIYGFSRFDGLVSQNCEGNLEELISVFKEMDESAVNLYLFGVIFVCFTVKLFQIILYNEVTGVIIRIFFKMQGDYAVYMTLLLGFILVLTTIMMMSVGAVRMPFVNEFAVVFNMIFETCFGIYDTSLFDDTGAAVVGTVYTLCIAIAV